MRTNGKRGVELKMKRCDRVIVLLSKNTWHSSGTRWEIKCAGEEEIPVIGMHIKKKAKGALPPEFVQLTLKEEIIWTWENLEKTISAIAK